MSLAGRQTHHFERSMPSLLFDPRFIPSILDQRKRATARSMRHTSAATLAIRQGDRCIARRADTHEAFAVLRVTHCESRPERALDDALAAIENYEHVEQLRRSLRRYYPDLMPSDTIRIIHFRVEAHPDAQ